jgi:hypothetical protein
MAKSLKPGLLRFATAIGAVRNRKPDWYLVAEELARIAVPELLEEQPAARQPGRPSLRTATFWPWKFTGSWQQAHAVSAKPAGKSLAVTSFDHR